MIAGNVSKGDRAGARVNFFQCVGCGEIQHHDIPHAPPGKRT
jgi:hypothetical protein